MSSDSTAFTLLCFFLGVIMWRTSVSLPWRCLQCCCRKGEALGQSELRQGAAGLARTDATQWTGRPNHFAVWHKELKQFPEIFSFYISLFRNIFAHKYNDQRLDDTDTII